MRFLLLLLLLFSPLLAKEETPPLKQSCWKSFAPKKKQKEKKKKKEIICCSEPSCYAKYDPCCENGCCPALPGCCPPIAMAVGAAAFGGAIAAVILSGCDESVTNHSLRFIVNQRLDTGGAEEVRIILPDSTIFQSYLLTNLGPNPSNLIQNPVNGTYAVNLILGQIQDPNNFSVDVIVNGTSVILGGSFTGSFPLLSFTYTLAL